MQHWKALGIDEEITVVIRDTVLPKFFRLNHLNLISKKRIHFLITPLMKGAFSNFPLFSYDFQSKLDTRHLQKLP